MVQNGGSDHIYRKAYAQQSPRERAHTEMAPPPPSPLCARAPLRPGDNIRAHQFATQRSSSLSTSSNLDLAATSS